MTPPARQDQQAGLRRLRHPFPFQAATIEFVQTNYEASRLDLSSSFHRQGIFDHRKTLKARLNCPEGVAAGSARTASEALCRGARRPKAFLSSRPRPKLIRTPLLFATRTIPRGPGLSRRDKLSCSPLHSSCMISPCLASSRPRRSFRRMLVFRDSSFLCTRETTSSPARVFNATCRHDLPANRKFETLPRRS